VKASQKIVFKQILFLCTLVHTLPVLAVRPIMAKAGVGAVAALAAENVRRSYNKRIAKYNAVVEECEKRVRWDHESKRQFEAQKQKDIQEAAEEKKWNVGEAAVIGLGVTSAAAFFLHKRLPIQRLKQAAALKRKVQDYYLMRPLGNQEAFLSSIKSYFRYEPFPGVAAFDGLVEEGRALYESRKLVELADQDFKADYNVEAEKECAKEAQHLAFLERLIAERILIIQASPQFAQQLVSARAIDAANRQARAARQAADNSDITAAASVVGVASYLARK
jgi:hypothetical protein